ncbi:hypothetical protein N7450_009677 [Penicillium hetheringtonii]|uniref:Centromere protein Cenp-O n=1 Tax=Penicillium hetheringtonii TaxID=911720 RepID=A0AAD6GNN4_9EURO|nr:hypothetical protein N7450_009677 [Penicillium hetheringtonii]
MRQLDSPDPEEQELDTDIRSIRAEIQTLQHPPPQFFKTTTPLILKRSLPLTKEATSHASTNHHRIAFGATAFPFKDPSPNTTTPNLLGIRIDVCARNGRFVKPYYILLRQERGRTEKIKRLRVHRHTIPAFISVEKLQGTYLPSTSTRETASGSDSDDAEPVKGYGKAGKKKQDLRAFVRELRRELVAWHLRSDAVEYLREKLGLSRDEKGEEEIGERLRNDLGIVGFEATALEARYVRIEWEDGRIGRFKLSNSGKVERAVFMNDSGRDKQVEDAVIGGGGRVESLLERLKSISE